MEGEDVVLRCSYKPNEDVDTPESGFPASFFRNGTFLGTEASGRMTLKGVSRSRDQGLYSCGHPTGGRSPQSQLSIKEPPGGSQFFKYSSVSLDCDGGWAVRRTTARYTAQGCRPGWATPRGPSSCLIEDALPTDSGQYWCESPRGGRSPPVNVTVIAQGVILSSPPHPVMEGEDVVLRCSYKPNEDVDTPESGFPASFFRNGTFLGTEASGRMTLKGVSRSRDQGLYSCEHPTGGRSTQSQLSIKARAPPPPQRAAPPPAPPLSWTRVLCGVLLLVLYNLLLVFCVYKYRKWVRARKAEKRRCRPSGGAEP
ncbi:putative high affinity immunoglobulin gamma Fc receptor IB [Menidia menidia]